MVTALGMATVTTALPPPAMAAPAVATSTNTNTNTNTPVVGEKGGGELAFIVCLSPILHTPSRHFLVSIDFLKGFVHLRTTKKVRYLGSLELELG